MIESAPEKAATGSSAKARQILDAARRLFTEQGYDAVSMDTIAQSASVSKATVYAHFASKESLFQTMIERQCQYCTAQMAVTEDADPVAVETTLRTLGLNYLHTVMQPEMIAVFRTLIAETARFPALGHAFYQAGPAITLAGIARYLERAHNRGTLAVPQVHLAAAQFLGMLRSDLQMRALLGLGMQSGADIETTVEAAVKVFMTAYASKQ